MLGKIDLMLKEIDVIIERLEYDFEYNPLKIMGLKATNGLMNTIYTTLASLGFAFIQSYVGGASDERNANID
eukprot:CAMPEP_0170549556 /NCGR_PEP_ID=MMETSP0211-20121228/7700_1 /TAXON_ID=311385 /ORGANISM="Pseudokeronopsis sp., Strain OXSARD2" /LENGTH=71 /DNA_ID=CAMNT_0010855629 /DNA_START=1844 /DNA_END=2059 /DNA_ORIENTATION=+